MVHSIWYRYCGLEFDFFSNLACKTCLGVFFIHDSVYYVDTVRCCYAAYITLKSQMKYEL